MYKSYLLKPIGCLLFFFGRTGFPYVQLLHACVSSHSQVQLITTYNKTFHGTTAKILSPEEARGESRWLMGDVVRQNWKVFKKKKKKMVLRQSLELLFVVWCFSKWLSPDGTELRFGEGRPPSVGRLVEWHPRTKEGKRTGRKRGPVFTWKSFIHLTISETVWRHEELMLY